MSEPFYICRVWLDRTTSQSRFSYLSKDNGWCKRFKDAQSFVSHDTASDKLNGRSGSIWSQPELLASPYYQAETSLKLDPIMKTKNLNQSLVPAAPAIGSSVTLVDGPATWQGVKYWADMAAKFQHASVAAQVMAGFALCELRKAHGTNQGKRTDLTSPHDAEKLDWPELVEQHAGISDDTARRWMLMAEGIKARWKKLAPQARLKELMSVAPSDWNEKDTKLVTDSLHKVCDGQGQLEFMRELGLAKKPTGNTTTTNRTPPGKLSAEEQAAQLLALALQDSGHLGNAVTACNKSFVLLEDLEINAQIALLERAIKLRNAWVSQPKSKRDVSVIEKMLKAAA